MSECFCIGPPGACPCVKRQEWAQRALHWLQHNARHDESNGPCYGRRNPYPDPDDSSFTCRCGLELLLSEADWATPTDFSRPVAYPEWLEAEIERLERELADAVACNNHKDITIAELRATHETPVLCPACQEWSDKKGPI